MKLSARARYAVRLMLEVHRLGGAGRPVRLSEIARSSGISRRFLEQLVMGLRNHSLLKGISGRHGGYFLSRSPSDISMREVITAVIGPISLAICVEDPDICSQSDSCECRLLWSLLQKRIDELLDQYSLADLGDKDILDPIRRQLEESEMVCKVQNKNCRADTYLSAGKPACAQALSEKSTQNDIVPKA